MHFFSRLTKDDVGWGWKKLKQLAEQNQSMFEKALINVLKAHILEWNSNIFMLLYFIKLLLQSW